MPRSTFLVLLLALFGLAVAVPEASGQDTVVMRFEEGEGDDVVDDESGDVIGRFEPPGAGLYSADVPDIGGDNEFSADLTLDAWIVIDGVGFPFHDVTAGGAEGDASVDFWANWLDQGHAATFWTNADDNGDANRFNIFWNASFTDLAGSDRFFSADFRDVGGALTDIGTHSAGIPLETFAWNHVVMERVDTGGGTYDWKWFYNGVENIAQNRSTVTALPLAMSWLIGGRQGGGGARMLIDEITITGEATGGGPCPTEGADFEDTACTSLTFSGPADNGAGNFTFTANATDGSGGTIFYTFEAFDDFGVLETAGPQTTDSWTVPLTEGPWTVGVVVDDNLGCDDDGPNVRCEVIVEVGSAPPFQDFHLRFEEGEGTDIVDSLSGNVVGQLLDGATFAPATSEFDCAGDFAMDNINGMGAMDIPFPLHDPSVGAPSDATVEFLFMVPGEHGHAAYFWTNFDDNADSNRFNMFWNCSFTGIPGSERCMSADYRDPGGAIADIGAPGHDTQLPFDIGVWYHLAITRADLGDDSWEWGWWINGEENLVASGAVTFVPLPTAQTWLIGGRSGGHALAFFIDEIKATGEVVDPDDFGCSGTPCPDDADTHCNGIEINPAANPGDPPAAGIFTVTATATDDSGDTISYSFTAENEFGDVKTSSGTDNSTAFSLSEGSWTISVTVDDSALCQDEANDTMCSLDIEVGAAPEVAPSYYRFEEGEGTDVIDDNTGDSHGQLLDGAIFSADVPSATVPQTGAANDFSVDFLAGFALMAAPFINHEPPVGAAGDTTVEYYMNVPAAHTHASWMWTNGDDNADSNRFNLFFNASFTGVGGSEQFIGGDWRDETGAITNNSIHDGGPELELGVWNHIAMVRIETGGEFEWKWYINGVEEIGMGTFSPNGPMPLAQTWLICGRSGAHALGALMDEIRMSNEALEPGDFLMDDGGDCTATQNPETSCNDGVDNDCDGRTDGADSDCDVVKGVGPFLRGDCDNNGSVGGSPTEAIVLLNFAFRGGAAPPCIAACDAEANGSIGITDALRILRHAFLGVGEPDAPFPNCTASDLGTDIELGCVDPAPCL